MSSFAQQTAPSSSSVPPSLAADPAFDPSPLVTPDFMPGPVDPSAASAAFGHFTEECDSGVRTHSEGPPISLGGGGVGETKPKRKVYKHDDPCAPKHEPTVGESIKLGIGKTWAAIEKFVNPREEPVYGPPQLPVLDANGRETDRYPDGRPVPQLPPNAAIGTRA